MCQKKHLSFWTPTNIPDPSLEDLTKCRQLTETGNPFADISRITYYECHTPSSINTNNSQQNQNQPLPTPYYYSPTPLCPTPSSSQPSTRTGPIRPFCPGDDNCSVRINNFARAFDAAAQALADARGGSRGARSTYDAPQQGILIWEVWERAQKAMGDWRVVWEAHAGCPARRTGDEVVCRLVNEGVMERPVEVWPERRLGENPFLFVLR